MSKLLNTYQFEDAVHVYHKCAQFIQDTFLFYSTGAKVSRNGDSKTYSIACVVLGRSKEILAEMTCVVTNRFEPSSDKRHWDMLVLNGDKTLNIKVYSPILEAGQFLFSLSKLESGTYVAEHRDCRMIAISEDMQETFLY